MTVQSYQPQINLTAYETASKQRQLIRLLFVLGVFALFALVLFKYNGWFRSILPGASNGVQVSTSDATAQKLGHATPATSRRNSSKHRADVFVPPASEAQLTSASGISEATFRSPLEVEVIYGAGQHQMIRTRDDSIYIDLSAKTLAAPSVMAANAGYATDEIRPAEQVGLPSGGPELVSPSVGSVDPLLAKQQTMEGSVVLLAQIDKDGNIQNLQAISGPETLLGAAREAVKQWRFKPYYKSGQAVETEAQITVKFAIAAH
jgi:TonB family protein